MMIIINNEVLSTWGYASVSANTRFLPTESPAQGPEHGPGIPPRRPLPRTASGEHRGKEVGITRGDAL